MARFYEKLTKPTALADGDIFVISVGSGTSWIDYKITYSQLKDVIKTISDMQNYYTKSQTYTKTETDNAIAAAVSSTYKFAGSKTCAELVSSLLVAANKGNVYNMTDSGTTTSDFVEGAGHEINVGDNVGIAEVSAGVYKFDLLSGLIDLTGYQTKNLASAIEGQTTVEGALAALSANKANLSEVYTKTQINDDFVKKSATAGLLKNDGSVDTNTYVPAVTGKGLSTEDYTSLEKLKLAGISDGATKTESSLTNGHLEIDDVDVTVYDDTDLSEDITTAQNTANTALAYAQNKVYGMRIRESVESNPASIISYLADAVGMTPVHMDYTNNVFDYGSWEDAWFIKDCKPCILGQDGVVQAYLNKNDYTKDIYGNTVTIDENLTGANVMIEFPKIWYKIVPVVPTCCDADVFISPVKLDDDYKDFAYIAQDKTHKEHFYMPAYNGSIINDGTNDVLRSLSGQAVGNSKTGTVEIEMAQRNGTGWYTETFSQVTLINLLLMLIGKSTDTQTVFGRGIDTGSQTAFNAYRTGAGNTKGMFWGSNDGTQLVKVFGIENWLALQWRRFGGLMCVKGTFKYKMCWGQEDGSTTDNYNTDASGYIESPSPAPSGTSGGYISRMFFTSVNMLMSVIGGSSSTKYCDGGWFNNSATTYALRGGHSNIGAICGAFALGVSNAVSDTAWYRGAALSYT